MKIFLLLSAGEDFFVFSLLLMTPLCMTPAGNASQNVYDLNHTLFPLVRIGFRCCKSATRLYTTANFGVVFVVFEVFVHLS